MESSIGLQEKSININKTKLNIDFCQIILEFGSVCFIISQLTEYSSKLKHNYSSLKDHLKELECLGLLKQLENGLRSGKNYCALYIKQLPESLSPESIEQFSLQYLKPIKISWSTYIQSCQRLILSSKSAVLSLETSNLLNNDVYRCIVQQQTSRELISINKTKSTKNRSKNSKTNYKITKTENNQNSILKYFHPIISTTRESSTTTNRNLSNIFNDHDNSQTIDISSSSPHQSSDIIKSTKTSKIIKSKYFRDKIIQAPCPKTFN